MYCIVYKEIAYIVCVMWFTLHIFAMQFSCINNQVTERLDRSIKSEINSTVMSNLPIVICTIRTKACSCGCLLDNKQSRVVSILNWRVTGNTRSKTRNLSQFCFIEISVQNYLDNR